MTMSEILDHLAAAFGGYSQVTDMVVGAAIIGQINNNGLKFTEHELNDIVNVIDDIWKDEANMDEIRHNICMGMKSAMDSYCKDSIADSIKEIVNKYI